MHCKGLVSVCLVVLVLNIDLVYSLDFRKRFDEFKSHFDISKLSIHSVKLQFDNLKKSMMDDAGGKFVWKSPGYLDYAYLAYDVGKPVVDYLDYTEGVELSEKELCQQLIGAGMGFGGSIIGTSVGSYLGTLALPGWGTLVGGLLGGNIGYTYGKTFGNGTVAESFCTYVVTQKQAV